MKRLTLIILGGAMLLLLAAATTQAAPPAQADPTPTPTLRAIRTVPPEIRPVPDPQQEGVLYFAASGHTLRPPMRGYWEQYGGLAQFGLPLSEPFREMSETDGKEYVVQYFERARFEHHPENAGTPYEVLLGHLGKYFHKPDLPVQPMDRLGSEHFAATGHNVSGAFLRYWQDHGGLFVNGYPITEAFMETSPTDGKEYLVQYFERARFELHPENAGTDNEVLLGLLGTQLLREKQWLP